jgi:hypothetical protein
VADKKVVSDAARLGYMHPGDATLSSNSCSSITKLVEKPTKFLPFRA